MSASAKRSAAPTSADIAAQVPLYKKSFVAWSESPAGFYVDQAWDSARKRWVKGWQPVRWPERIRRVYAWMLTFDEDGRLPVDTFWKVDIGKSGKTLEEAAVAQWFGMWVDSNAEVQLAANSVTQAGVRVFKALQDSVSANPYPGVFIARNEVSEIEFALTRNVIRPIPMKATTIAGGNPIFIGIDEVWGWEGDTGRVMYAELKRAPTRNTSFKMVVTYPPYLDTAGPANDVLGEFFDDEEQPRPGTEQVPGLEDLPLWVRGRTAIWWNHDPYEWHEAMGTLAEARSDPAVSDADYQRIWEARRVSSKTAFMPMDAWDACVDPDWLPGLPLGPQKGLALCVGVDIGTKHDTSAVVARSYDPATGRYPLVAHRIWMPGLVPTDTSINALVEQFLRDLARYHRLLVVGYDPHQFHDSAIRLRREGLPMEEFTQVNRRTEADTQYRTLILTRRLRNYEACDDLRSHVQHAVARAVGSDQYVRIDKRRANRAIDAAVADSMCCSLVAANIDRMTRLAKARGLTVPLPGPSPWKRVFG